MEVLIEASDEFGREKAARLCDDALNLRSIWSIFSSLMQSDLLDLPLDLLQGGFYVTSLNYCMVDNILWDRRQKLCPGKCLDDLIFS